MSKLSIPTMTVIVTLALAVAAAPAAPLAAQTCGPLNDGRIANVFYEGTALFFEPVVEYREVVLTITGPCEDIVRTFGPKDQISFDIREIQRVTDGQYNWQLKRVAADPGLEEELQSYRGSGKEDAVWWDFFQSGKIPEGPYTDSGSFTVVNGSIIDPSSGEEKSATIATNGLSAPIAGAAAGSELTGGSDGNTLATKDTVLTVANGVIRNSLCIGFDCANSNTYSDSTILLTENNTRIKFDDTSTSSSFPRNDWEIQANSNANGGGNWLGFNDCGQNGGGADGGGCADDLVFAVEAGVRQHALYVESSGEVGFGTNNPVLELHTVAGDTPGLRLEQDGSNGFQPQIWDLAGNETSFFVRDVTNGSTLPFRVFPDSSSNTLVVRDSDVRIGTLSNGSTSGFGGVDANLYLRTSGGSEGGVLVENASSTSSQRVLLELRNQGNVDFAMVNSASGDDWRFQNFNGNFRITKVGTGVGELSLDGTGDLTITGEIFTNGSCSIGCDRVFAPDYNLETIKEHAAQMWANSYLPAVGPTPEEGTINLSRKTTGMLNELEKAHIYIEQLNDKLEQKEARLSELEGRLTDLEELLQSSH